MRVPGSFSLNRRIVAGAEPDNLCTTIFYGDTLEQREIPERSCCAWEAGKLREVLRVDEVVRFLESTSSLKTRVTLTTAFAVVNSAGFPGGIKFQILGCQAMDA